TVKGLRCLTQCHQRVGDFHGIRNYVLDQAFIAAAHEHGFRRAYSVLRKIILWKVVLRECGGITFDIGKRRNRGRRKCMRGKSVFLCFKRYLEAIVSHVKTVAVVESYTRTSTEWFRRTIQEGSIGTQIRQV